MKQKNALILAVVWLLIMVSIVASAATLLVTGRVNLNARWVSAEQYEMLERYMRLEQVRTELNRGYVQQTDDDALMNGALKGMMAALGDPYSYYYTQEEMQAYEQETQGEYTGLGMLVQSNENGDIEIIRLYSDGPAERAGIQVGDCILRVNGAFVSGDNAQTLSRAIVLMKGESGREITLTLRRGGELIDVTAVCGEVNINNVSCTIMENGIAYIDIFQFTGDCVTGFEQALKKSEESGANGMIIDLRNNPGGMLDQVVEIADMILPEGTIVYTEDREGSREDFYSDAKCIDLPLAVIINESSASASEILAAAVQDFNRGTVLGEKSYGKGVVQSVIAFEDGSGMQYTSSCYYTPSGNSINGTGVTPDLLVAAADGFVSYSGIPDPENDVQLQMAIDILQREMNEGDTNHD